MNGIAYRRTVDELGDLYGIGRTHTGNDHIRVRYSVERRAKVLTAAGWDSSTPEAAAASLERMRGRLRASPIDPAKVVLQAELPFSFEVRVPEGATHCSYVIHLEEGGKQRGKKQFRSKGKPDTKLGGFRHTIRHPDRDLPLGIHQMEVKVFVDKKCVAKGKMPLFICPEQCYQGKPGRGIIASCIATNLRDRTDLGAADGGTIRKAIWQAAAAGADGFLGGPLHQIEPTGFGQYAPFMAWSRRYYTSRLIDIEETAGWLQLTKLCQQMKGRAFVDRAAELRAEKVVLKNDVDLFRMKWLDKMWAAFKEEHVAKKTVRHLEFERFKQRGGSELLYFGIASAIAMEKFPPFTFNDSWHWKNWGEYSVPDPGKLKSYYADNRDKVEYYLFVQWLATREVRLIDQTCDDAGMGIGWVNCLPVGLKSAAFDRWIESWSFMRYALGGSLPDAFNWDGQLWDLTPRDPFELWMSGYAPFVRDLEAGMEYAGELEIDHAMSLIRMLAVAPGCTAKEGVYVHYRAEDLMAILALISQRHKCRVCGEFLGTLPDNALPLARKFGIFALRQVRFEQDYDKGVVNSTRSYPPNSCTIGDSRDLPPLLGWMFSWETGEKLRLGLITQRTARKEAADRVEEVPRLLTRYVQEGDLAEADKAALIKLRRRIGMARSTERIAHLQSDPLIQRLLDAHFRFIARTRSKCDIAKGRGATMMIGFTEADAGIKSPNLPGSGEDQRENWVERYLNADDLITPRIARAFDVAKAVRTPKGAAA